MSEISNDLYQQLRRGPAFLLLGEDYLRLETGSDPFLAEVMRKYGPADVQPEDYRQIWKGDAHNSPDSTLPWMAALSDRLSVPHWLKVVADFPWNGLYISAIDTIWVHAFRSTVWRELHLILNDKYIPIDPRSRLRLHSTCLFGAVSRTERDERPPLTKFEWNDRRPIASRLASRLPELITPLGVLIIEGYAGERDWFPPEDLYAIVNALNPGQVHIFNVSPELTQNDEISALVQQGKLILHEEGLAIFLLRGDEAGWLALGKRPDEEQHGRRVSINGKTVLVPSEVWNRVTTSAQILDEAIVSTPPHLSTETRYSDFRNFLSEASIRPVWSGYARDFSFHREYEGRLAVEVERRLQAHRLQNEPIVLYGPTGTGKSVALGALAYRICKEGKYPVLFIERKPQKPSQFDIDYYCQWAENNGAPVCLIVWDGMVELDYYYELVRYLSGRGRKVVVVGSCYRSAVISIDTQTSQNQNYVEAPSFLTESESAHFARFLDNILPGSSAALRAKLGQPDSYFLVALYRLLPTTRTGIRAGVSSEISYAEQQIESRIQESTLDPAFSNALGLALLEANLIDPKDLVEGGSTKELGGERFNEYQQLTGLIMVPGRFGIKVPIELVLRALGRDQLLYFADLMKNLDIFRWYEDGAGNPIMGPRHPLEARLFVQARLGGQSTELAFAKQLILEIKPSDGTDNSSEVQFVVELVRAMGPNSENAAYFAPYFRELSGILTALREERGIHNPRFMLQEASILRESVVQQSRTGTRSPDSTQLLDQAESILRQALDLLGTDQHHNRLKSFILVELASTLGSKAREFQDNFSDTGQLFREARNVLLRARTIDPGSYHPIDVMAWVARDLLNSGVLTQQERAEVEADVLHFLETAAVEDFPVDQQAQYQTRRMELGPLLNRQDLSDEAFRALLAQGSTAGYYLRASRIAGDLPIGQELSPVERTKCLDAVEYLQSHREAITNDGRCLNLLLRLWWMGKVGKPMFYKERQTVPFTRRDWIYCREIVSQLMAAGDMYRTPSLQYLDGLATFHIEGLDASLRIFRELEQEETQGRRRIIRSYLASTEDGRPQVFNGTVARFSNRNRGEIYVEELRQRVTFIPVDFGRPDIRVGETLSNFHLAFNFIGPIADSAGFLQDHNEEPK